MVNSKRTRQRSFSMQILMFRDRQHDNENGKIKDLIFLVEIGRKWRHAFLNQDSSFRSMFR